MDYFSLLTALSLGLLGGAHCMGMCGGVMGALTMAVEADNYARRLALVLSYNLGRMLSYVLISALFYWLIQQLSHYFLWQFMRYVAGALLIAMGLYLANWWQGLTRLEKIGAYLWRYLQPLSRSLLPVHHSGQALLLGMLWGWLPCGLIYSALAYAATATSMINAMLIMFSFALGTLPAVLATGLLAERLSALIRRQALRRVFAVLIMLFGLWTLWGSAGHHHHHMVDDNSVGHEHHH
ncbi:MAG: sulfite exporter TauE/SafE family protein [Cellvibrionaceae bacterium]|nr:sulfite exporter TauE/SafE family protein [Cellvibrionaceae bacterium]